MLSAFAVYSSSEDFNRDSKKKLAQKSFSKKKRSTTNSKSNKLLNKVVKKKNSLKNKNKLPNSKPIKSKLKKVKLSRPIAVKTKLSNANDNLNIELQEPICDIEPQTSIKNKIKHSVAIANINLNIEQQQQTCDIKPQKSLKIKKKQCVVIDEIDGDVFAKPVALLSWLLAPISVSDFCNTYWETKPLHIVRNNSNYFKNLFSSKEIDKILRENPLYYTRNVDVVTYENGQRETHNPEGRAIPANVWDYYMNGCSVRIMNPHTYHQKVRSLLSTLQEYFGTMVGVNVYLTPAGSQGFAPHYDDIEAFVIQLEGHKNWKIYAPRSENEILPRYSSKNLPRNELETPLTELTLHAGDLLYFPRGFIHEAFTDPDEHSLHITVSVYQNTAYVDLLEKLLPQALKTASECDVNFRKGLPLNYLKHVGVVNAEKRTPDRKEILNKVKELMCKLVDYASVDTAADQLGRKFMYEALPPHLTPSERERSSKEDGDRLENGRITNIAAFSPDTMVRLTRYHSQRLVIEDGAVKICYCTENANVYHGEEEQFLELNDALVNTIKALQNKYPQYVSIESLPCSDDVEKIQGISDLWEKGLIITKTPLDIEDE